MLDAIIFDFDGVICESVEAKTEAFRKLFLDQPEHLEKILQFHIVNGGLSRYKKFKVIYQDFLKRELTEKESVQLGQRFTEYCYDSVVKSLYVKGAYEFLKRYHKQFRLYVASGTPQDEIQSIIKERKLDQFFVAVYGSPRTKADLLRAILAQGRLKTDQVIFVGDSINDYAGAKATGIRFIGRVHPNYPNPFNGICLEAQIADLTELDCWAQREIIR